MSHPLTTERFEQFEKHLDQRFDAVDKRFDTQEANHQDLMLAVADVITRVNDHLDERLDRLEQFRADYDRSTREAA